MKKIFFLIVSAICLASCRQAPKYANRAEAIAAQMHNPDSKYVVVACHRGDWRNFPENSAMAIESIIKMGAKHGRTSGNHRPFKVVSAQGQGHVLRFFQCFS